MTRRARHQHRDQHPGPHPERYPLAPSAGALPEHEQAHELEQEPPQAAWLPEFLEVAPRHVAVGSELAATLAVVGYPREVYAGWLEPLITYPGRLDICLHIEPVPAEVAANRLRRQLARLESGRAGDAQHGRLADPHVDAATEDAYELANRIARCETRLHRVGLYLTVRASDPDELAEHLAAVRSLAASMLLDARPTTYRALQGWISCLPLGLDCLGQHRAMDTDSIAAAFPFTSPDLPAGDPVTAATPSGVLYGTNVSSGGLVIWDRFAQPNYNSVILARAGAGKSYLVKLELLRSLYRGVHAVVIDPEDEYTRLAEAVGGTHVRLGAPGVRVNPLDLPVRIDTAGRVHAPPDTLHRRWLYLHTVLGVLLGGLTSEQTSVADRAIHACYANAGISTEPHTWSRPAPLLGDLAAALAGLDDPIATELAHRLAPYVSGSFSGLFNGPTTTAPAGHLVVFSLKELPEELKAIGTLLALDATWRTVTDPADRRPRLVVVDEAWLLMAQPAGAEFLLKLAKTARKRWVGLTVVTQDVGDVLSTEAGKAIVASAATQILLRTAAQAAPTVTEAFALSEGERTFLTSCDTGSGLLAGARHRVAFTAQASPTEHELITTDPAELAAAEAIRADPPTPPPSHGHDRTSRSALYEEGADPL